MKKGIIFTIASLLVVSVLGFIGWRLQAGSVGKPTRTVEATRQTVVQEISFTGTVESQQLANISFELSGAIKDLYVSVGDVVTKGQKLALLDPQSVELELAKAHADKASTTSTQLLTWQKAVEDAKNTNSENTKALEQKRQAVRDAKAALDQSKELFAQRAKESGDDSSVTLATESTVIANTAAYNSAKAALETAIKTATKANTAAKQAADIAHTQYINALQAAPGDRGLSSLSALEQLARVKTNKSILRAPFDGVITKKNIEIGELATVGNPILTIETIDSLQISANVPETDAFALAENMNASVTFDALSDTKEVAARVQEIYPAASPLEGVPTFRVVIAVHEFQEKLRSGITANITVHAAKREHVIAIPRRAIISKSDKQFVRKQTGEGESSEIEITTGLIGSDGLVEVTSGLKEGDMIVTP